MYKTPVFHLLFAIVIAFTFNCYSCIETDKNVVFKTVDRSIDLTSQLLKITTTVSVENSGPKPVNSIIWTVNKNDGRLSFIGVRDSTKRELNIKENPEESTYTITLIKPIEKNKRISVIVEEVYMNAQIPYPASITQKEKQLIKYNGNHYLYAAYVVEQQTTKVHVRTKNIESYSKLKPFTLADGIITYGPYENIQPLTVDHLSIHCENNSPFLTVTNLKRHIEISHWGNIAIEEHVNLLHTGATLKGPFSRYDYQRDNSGFNSIKSFKTILPASAERPYYRDFNGNISTSNMQIKKDSVELELRPRFPLFGGWKTCYTLGYSVPSYQYLYQKGDNYLLKIRLIDHVFDYMQVENLETTISLPVGAENIKLKTPYPVNRMADTIEYKYLDTKGRPVIKFNIQHLVENHIQDLELSYQWPRVLMIHEPILLSLVLFLLFLVVIVYVRLDFSIYKNTSTNGNKKQQ